eukprot:1082487-Prorocentrum_minimum.AAC.1
MEAHKGAAAAGQANRDHLRRAGLEGVRLAVLLAAWAGAAGVRDGSGGVARRGYRPEVGGRRDGVDDVKLHAGVFAITLT